MTLPQDILLLSALFLLAAMLYSSVGHGGASAYLAVMSLAGFAPGWMKPTALMLNIVVSLIATIQFARARHFSWPLFWPFAMGSIPLAFFGGYLVLSDPLYRAITGAVLLVAAFRIFLAAPKAVSPSGRPVPVVVAILIGGAIGLVSGMVGVGGGIFLSPLLLLCRWADAPRTSAVSAAFILVNSIAGIVGLGMNRSFLPADFSWNVFGVLAAAVILGGTVGSTIGSRRFSTIHLRRVLAIGLIIAGIKMILPR